MRLRIKTSNGKLERISIPDNSTLADLTEHVAGICPENGAADIKLSLNKKAEIGGAATDTLRAAGVCSGDTLWVLTPDARKQNEGKSDQSQIRPEIATTRLQTSGVQRVSGTAEKSSPRTEQLNMPSEDAQMQDADAELQKLEEDQHELDVHISSSPGLLQRVLGTCAEPIQSLHQLMLLTMHAVLLETGMQLTHQEDKYALPKDALSRCSSACQLQYRLQQQQGHPVYEVKYIGLGAGMACIAATSDGSRVTTLNVSLQQHLQQQLMQIGCEPQEAISAFTNMQQLWTDLKDGLALKMLAGLRQIAGLSPPPGLLALPAELRTKILANLQAQDLSTVECCCTELRHTASSDMFWQPLFQLEFGFVTSHEKTQAGRLGWQGMFTHKWTERERMRRRPRRHPRLAPFPMRGTFAPPGPPGIITGGDYDRLPQPFLGGTPGMFGGALGGSGFGGQGPPSSLFLGSSRGSGRAARAAGSFRLS